MNRFAWTVHNLVAHPLAGILWCLGLVSVANAVHDATIPVAERRTEAEGERTQSYWLWLPHNLIGHPLSEIAHLLGASRLSTRLHDATIPGSHVPRPSAPR